MFNICGDSAGQILRAVDDNAGWLTSLGGEAITQRRNSQGRSVKQILGHLVDSASNNHQRMVRLQYNEELVFPDYTRDNDRWIAIQDYQNAGWERLVELWRY